MKSNIAEPGLFHSIATLLDRRFGSAHRERRQYKRQVREFKRSGGQDSLYNHPQLNGASVVVDLGAYKGQWADGISKHAHGHIHLFEAHPGFAAALVEQYDGRASMTVHPVALGNRSGELLLSDLGDASTSYRADGPSVQCRMVEAATYLEAIGVRRIDLIKINIEGGEYDLLEHLIDTGLIDRIGTLLIQFHKFSDGDETRREAIRCALSATHKEEWCYPFIWEQWARR